MATVTFNDTGAEQTWTVPTGVSWVDIECWGARGGDGVPGPGETVPLGGKGGYAKGRLTVTTSEVLRIYVGGRGVDGAVNVQPAGGWNGGAGGEPSSGSGGGASDVRQGGAVLANRKIVAGGGGGGGGDWDTEQGTAGAGGGGGHTAGVTGAAGTTYGGKGGGGGTQTAGGAGGAGGVYAPNEGKPGAAGTLGVGGIGGRGHSSGSGQGNGGGGGGGYYGGGGGGAGAYTEYNFKVWAGGGGGGGSSYVGGTTSTNVVNSTRDAAGLVVFTYTVNTAPNAPTLGAPAANAKITPGAPATFSWTHSDPEGDAQNGYAFRRRIGTSAYEWWNAGTATWTSTEHVNTSSTQSVQFPANKWTDNTTYNWSVATRDPAGLLGAYSAQRDVVVQSKQTLTYTGAAQTYTVPVNVTQVSVECWGAEGTGGNKGQGGYAKGVLAVTAGEILNVYVGGRTGWNGGAPGGSAPGGYSSGYRGGDATDIRQGGTALSDRKVVAGGGGGQAGSSTSGGDAGGTTGTTGNSGGGAGGGKGGAGGTQSAGGAGGSSGGGGSTSGQAGALGVGGNGGGSTSVTTHGAGGGGGGYYGGGGGGQATSGYASGGGGGGSSYVGALTSGATTAGVRVGDGEVIITAVTPPIPSAPANNLPLNLTQSNTAFSWSSSVVQAQYAFYRRAWGSSTKEWWNGTSWQGTEYWVASTTEGVTVSTANWPSDDAAYYWAVATKDSGGTTTPYSSEFAINPWEIWDGSNFSPSEQEMWVSQTTDSMQIDQSKFVSGQYRYAIKTRDAANQESPYTEAGFTFGGAILREGWGQVFI